MSEELISQIYNAFNPLLPVPPGDRIYVDYRAVRGNEDILRELGNTITRSAVDRHSCKLYTGHRGSGKTTELWRLRKHLEERQCQVIYFDADAEDIDSEDVQYTDILLACTRNILKELKPYNTASGFGQIQEWLASRIQSLRALGLSEVLVEDINIDSTIPLFAKITATLKAVPNQRDVIRQQVDIHTPKLIEILNDFIQSARKNLPQGKDKIVVIVDSLDRIGLVKRADNSTNYEEIFIDRSEQLTKLACHVIYTAPIALIYSNHATRLADIYGDTQVLPSVGIKKSNEDLDQGGLAKLRETIAKRCLQFPEAKNWKLAPDPSASEESVKRCIFASEELVKRLCVMSGGHVRDLIRFVQTALDWVDTFPITEEAAEKALSYARLTFYRTVQQEEWLKLAKVYRSKRIENKEDYRSLLFNRCVLEYSNYQGGKVARWYDVHPLIQELDEFKEVLEIRDRG